MAEYTLTYSENSKGWPSFYSYIPEKIIGMNNYLYSFKNGKLYRHNSNASRSNFYGVQYDTKITSVFNNSPLESKLFKTIELESNAPWSASLETDLLGANNLPQTASMDSTFFVEKEGNQFTFIRYVSDDINFLIRYANGIGNVTTVDTSTPSATTLTFTSGVVVGTIVSIGDNVYYGSTPNLGGVITAIDTTNNILTINTTISGASAPSNGDFILFVKNTVAESHGILGHYMKYTLTNTTSTAVELFASASETMKSYP